MLHLERAPGIFVPAARIRFSWRNFAADTARPQRLPTPTGPDPVSPMQKVSFISRNRGAPLPVPHHGPPTLQNLRKDRRVTGLPRLQPVGGVGLMPRASPPVKAFQHQQCQTGVLRNNVTDNHVELAVGGRGETEALIQMPGRTGSPNEHFPVYGNLISSNAGLPERGPPHVRHQHQQQPLTGASCGMVDMHVNQTAQSGGGRALVQPQCFDRPQGAPEGCGLLSTSAGGPWTSSPHAVSQSSGCQPLKGMQHPQQKQHHQQQQQQQQQQCRQQQLPI
jgi:hypothetical protein